MFVEVDKGELAGRHRPGQVKRHRLVIHQPACLTAPYSDGEGGQEHQPGQRSG